MAAAPELLVPLLTASFECMASVPLEGSGQLPPPPKVTQRWKEEAMARLSMAKVRGRAQREARYCAVYVAAARMSVMSTCRLAQCALVFVACS